MAFPADSPDPQPDLLRGGTGVSALQESLPLALRVELLDCDFPEEERRESVLCSRSDVGV